MGGTLRLVCRCAHMQILRSLYDPPLITPHGVQFCLDGGDKKVHCIVTRAALIFLAGHALLERDYQTIFEVYREEIEGAASHRYQDGHQQQHRLIVHAHDLVTYAHDIATSDKAPAAVA
ncbi:MAG: DUF1488 domain-containing protein [Alphaproteobacteria bacterium]|nr:MAG: DUF1488 domain-containing protein [Alphaproteobacteria bacterium]